MRTEFNKTIKYIRIVSIGLIIFFTGCKKFVEVNPPTTKISSSVVYSNDQTANAAIVGIYDKLSLANYSSTANISNLSLFAGLSADEFNLYSGAISNRKGYYQNALNANVPIGTELWSSTYPYIFSCNTAISGLNASTSLTPAVKTQLLGEAEFLRAFFYFYLVNFYGDVPLVLSTDYTVTASLPRTSKDLIYQQIISDLKDAQNKLNPGYVMANGITTYPNSSAERIRPNQSTATALLARAYLYTQKWDSAEAQATSIINNSAVYNLVPLNNAFLKNNNEAIWQWQPVTTGSVTNTPEALFFVLTVAPAGFNSTHSVSLSSSLLNSFEPGDLRKVNGNWINSYTNSSGTFYYPYKYKVVTTGTGVVPTEYRTIFRLGEQYLIRAEARAQRGNIGGAQADLNMIRTRAGLSNTTASDQSSLLTAIYHERQVEFFSEWGHRWLDLKRTGQIDAVMSVATPLKANGASWRSYQQLYPVLPSDIRADPNLVQNSGY